MRIASYGCLLGLVALIQSGCDEGAGSKGAPPPKPKGIQVNCEKAKTSADSQRVRCLQKIELPLSGDLSITAELMSERSRECAATEQDMRAFICLSR